MTHCLPNPAVRDNPRCYSRVPWRLTHAYLGGSTGPCGGGNNGFCTAGGSAFDATGTGGDALSGNPAAGFGGEGSGGGAVGGLTNAVPGDSAGATTGCRSRTGLLSLTCERALPY